MAWCVACAPHRISSWRCSSPARRGSIANLNPTPIVVFGGGLTAIDTATSHSPTTGAVGEIPVALRDLAATSAGRAQRWKRDRGRRGILTHALAIRRSARRSRGPQPHILGCCRRGGSTIAYRPARRQPSYVEPREPEAWRKALIAEGLTRIRGAWMCQGRASETVVSESDARFGAHRADRRGNAAQTVLAREIRALRPRRALLPRGRRQGP